MSESERSVVDDVRARFGAMALDPEREARFPIGPAHAASLGYDPAEIARLPAAAARSFCGVGNPLGLGAVEKGETVLDLGCGAAMDALLAAARVGPRGMVIGLDFTAQMVARAREAAESAGARNLRLALGALESLPLRPASVDLILSNGALNLCPNKRRALTEAFRVLRPGGRLRMADILRDDAAAERHAAESGGWSD